MSLATGTTTSPFTFWAKFALSLLLLLTKITAPTTKTTATKLPNPINI